MPRCEYSHTVCVCRRVMWFITYIYVMNRITLLHIYMCVNIMCICHKNHSFGIFPVKNLQKIAQGAFFLHLDIVNVMLDCWFNPDRALLLFLCSCLCAPFGFTEVTGPGVHTRAHWLVYTMYVLSIPLTVLSTFRVCVLWNSSSFIHSVCLQ